MFSFDAPDAPDAFLERCYESMGTRMCPTPEPASHSGYLVLVVDASLEEFNRKNRSACG